MSTCRRNRHHFSVSVKPADVLSAQFQRQRQRQRIYRHFDCQNYSQVPLCTRCHHHWLHFGALQASDPNFGPSLPLLPRMQYTAACRSLMSLPIVEFCLSPCGVLSLPVCGVSTNVSPRCGAQFQLMCLPVVEFSFNDLRSDLVVWVTGHFPIYTTTTVYHTLATPLLGTHATVHNAVEEYIPCHP